MKRIPITGPSITAREIEYVTDAATNGWYERAYEYIERFETAFSAYMGTRYSISLPSCTSAIHLSLAAAGVGPGDEVIVPEATWIASAVPAVYLGAEPVFADIDPRTWCISLDSLETCITPRTKAVVPVDLYGNFPDMARLRMLAERHGFTIVEDAAQAIGSRLNCKLAGGFGDTGTFSFHGTKTMTTGEGGMVVTNDERLFELMASLRDHGRVRGEDSFWNVRVGYKYKMSALQAALGLAQLERIDELVAMKRRIFGWYRERLGVVDGLTLNSEPEGVFNTFWMVNVFFDPVLGVEKKQISARMRERSIDTRPFFFPLSSLPAFARQRDIARAQKANRTMYALSPYGINLPCGMNLTEADVDRVCTELLAAVRVR